jgi:hypothetical protein
MEVHHHSHTARKKWTHYFWEFLMLFLAVFCGFLAENQREHMIEHQREKQYIKSMIQDLETDTSNLVLLSGRFKKKELLLDSVIRSFNDGVHTYSATWAKQFLRSYRGGFSDFYPTDRTIQQLKNAGGLRLIKNEAAANGIVRYDAAVKDVQGEEKILSILQDRYIEEVMKTWSVEKMLKDAAVTSWNDNKNMDVKNNYWLTTEPIAFQHLFNKLSEFNEAILRQTGEYKGLKEKAVLLIKLLKKEYHLE